MMIFYLRLKRISKPIHTRHKFDLEKMKESNVLETFQVMIGRLVSKLVLLAQSTTEDYIRAVIGGKFAPLTNMYNEDTDIDSMITTFNTAVTETTSEILGKHHQKKNHGSL